MFPQQELWLQTTWSPAQPTAIFRFRTGCWCLSTRLRIGAAQLAGRDCGKRYHTLEPRTCITSIYVPAIIHPTDMSSFQSSATSSMSGHVSTKLSEGIKANKNCLVYSSIWTSDKAHPSVEKQEETKSNASHFRLPHETKQKVSHTNKKIRPCCIMCLINSRSYWLLLNKDVHLQWISGGFHSHISRLLTPSRQLQYKCIWKIVRM